VLRPRSRLTLEWLQADRKWWLLVNGSRAGYYPDSLWDGHFTSTDLAEVFGEVRDRPGECISMGDGRWPTQPGAAQIFDVTFIGGPLAQLSSFTRPTARTGGAG
jgi:hypothetical protein